MFGRRWIGFALMALLVIVVISTLGGSAQQNAWMQGYMAGRLSAGTDGAVALAPYMIPGSPFMPRYGGFGHGIGLFIGLGFLALGVFALTRGRGHHRHWQARKQEWARHMQEEARRWHEESGGPGEARPEDRPGGDESQRV
jgi:hypothetical protein